MPALQFTHDDLPVVDVYVPATQLVQLTDPAVEYVPALQLLQVVAPVDDHVPVSHE